MCFFFYFSTTLYTMKDELFSLFASIQVGNESKRITILTYNLGSLLFFISLFLGNVTYHKCVHNILRKQI